MEESTTSPQNLNQKIISAAMNLVPDTLDCTLEYTSKEVAGATAILLASLG